MEKLFGSIKIPSLKQIALRRVAVVLWNKPDILASIAKFRETSEFGEPYKKWYETVECEVLKKITQLQLPELLAKKLLQIIKPVGLKILRWKLYHEAYLSPLRYTYGTLVTYSCVHFNLPVLEKLRYTVSGTLDYEKTAEELIKSNAISIVKRYKLACLYCLDHYIPELWKELPQKNKNFFCNEKESIRAPILPFSWPFILKGEEYKLNRLLRRTSRNLNSVYLHILSYESRAGNKSAVKYFLQKLPLEERESCIVYLTKEAVISTVIKHRYPVKFPQENLTDIICHLLSLMTFEQKIEIFRERPCYVLGIFLYWPWHDTFLDVADAMWTWIQCDDLQHRRLNYLSVLSSLRQGIKNSDYLPSLYQNFFLRSPSDFKKCFADQEWFSGSFFMELFTVQDTETICVILRNLDAKDRVRLLSTKHMRQHFYDCISSGSGHAVENLLRDIGLSKKDKEKVKKAFIRFTRRKNGPQIDLEAPEWKRFLEFLDENDDKRNADNDTPTRPKRLCRRKKNSN